MPKLEAFEINMLGHEAESTREPALTSGSVAVPSCLFRRKCNAHFQIATCNVPSTAALKRRMIDHWGAKRNLATSQKTVYPRYHQHALHELLTMFEGTHDLDYDARRICVATDQLQFCS